ncbi:STAS domain-containing protein [Streptomyces sp. NPDC058623]|uniref:STAS domain-containing protein n=1 Tax=Streptomyces sp. NPDC058623 TaxID=3346563 RepID=UPI00364BC74C
MRGVGRGAAGGGPAGRGRCPGDHVRGRVRPGHHRPAPGATDAALADPAVRRIALDVTGVEFADSTFLNLLLRLRRTGRLVLIGPTPHRLNRVFDLTQAGDLFQVVAHAQDAYQL